MRIIFTCQNCSKKNTSFLYFLRYIPVTRSVTGMYRSVNHFVAFITSSFRSFHYLFPSDGHLASWAGLCPGNNESAKKRKSGKTRKGNALLQETLVVSAHSAVKNKKSYFYAQFMRISTHRGKKRAYVAVAHSMLIAIYHILKDGVPFKDLGADYYNQFNKERKIHAYLKKLKALGWEAPVVAT